MISIYFGGLICKSLTHWTLSTEALLKDNTNKKSDDCLQVLKCKNSWSGPNLKYLLSILILRFTKSSQSTGNLFITGSRILIVNICVFFGCTISRISKRGSGKLNLFMIWLTIQYKNWNMFYKTFTHSGHVLEKLQFLQL